MPMDAQIVTADRLELVVLEDVRVERYQHRYQHAAGSSDVSDTNDPHG